MNGGTAQLIPMYDMAILSCSHDDVVRIIRFYQSFGTVFNIM